MGQCAQDASCLTGMAALFAVGVLMSKVLQ